MWTRKLPKESRKMKKMMILLVVNFDNNGKVVAYNSVKTHPHNHPY